MLGVEPVKISQISPSFTSLNLDPSKGFKFTPFLLLAIFKFIALLNFALVKSRHFNSGVVKANSLKFAGICKFWLKLTYGSFNFVFQSHHLR